MNSRLQNLFHTQATDSNGIYRSKTGFATAQSTEIELRERVATKSDKKIFDLISCNHSISVMDYEVDRFLAKLPPDALILDIGGCWGWHWRRLAKQRPDVGVVIVDFVRANLIHAQEVLGDLVGSQVALMHADATALPFTVDAEFTGFDGVWTVQTFQHIPDFACAVREANRVLCQGGVFVNYSLHITPLHRLLYFLVGKKYHIKGARPDMFYLERANDAQQKIIAEEFGSKVINRYTECLFHPQFGLSLTGSEGSLLGKIDSRLAAATWVACWIARQRSFETHKA